MNMILSMNFAKKNNVSFFFYVLFDPLSKLAQIHESLAFFLKKNLVQ